MPLSALEIGKFFFVFKAYSYIVKKINRNLIKNKKQCSSNWSHPRISNEILWIFERWKQGMTFLTWNSSSKFVNFEFKYWSEKLKFKFHFYGGQGSFLAITCRKFRQFQWKLGGEISCSADHVHERNLDT